MGPRWLWGLRRGLILFGELAVTLGLVTVLLATYELWWTNRTAEANASQTVSSLERRWDQQAQQQARQQAQAPSPLFGPTPGASRSGTPTPAAGDGGSWGGGGSGGVGASGIDSMARDLAAFAVIRIPALGLVFPVAQGVDKYAVLNHGYIGHYPGTAMPGQEGNFAVAGHRNTHGQPFRYLDRIRVGDAVIVEVSGWDYVYQVDSVLPQTDPGDGTVVLPEPYSTDHPSSRYGYRTPGRYITLTTCTPPFTSLYRMVVWGRLVGEQPRPVTVGGVSPSPSQAPRLPHAPGAPVRAGIPEHGRMPKYYLAKAQLTELLDELGEGATLPAERELAERYGVARETLRLALRELLLEGRVRRQGRGTVVAGPKIEQPLALGSYTEGVRKQGHTPGRRLIGLERFAAADDAAAHELGVERGDFVWHLERVLLVDEERVGLESTYAPVALLPRLDEDFDPAGSFYAYARDAGGLVSGGGEERIETVLATPREALLIGTPPALPMLLLHRRSWDAQGRPFERVRTLYRGDRFSFSTELRSAG